MRGVGVNLPGSGREGRMKRTMTLLGAVVMAAVMTFSMATPAEAARQRVRDRADAPRPIDTRALYVQRQFQGYVVTTFASPTYNAGRRWNGLEVRYDAFGDGRLDFRLLWSFGGDGDGYERFALVRGNGTLVDCPDAQAKSRKRNGWAFVFVYVPRSCLSLTKRVGVQGVTWDYTRYNSSGVPTRGRTDRAPNRGFAR